MNIVERRELVQYGYRTKKNYNLALKMLKSFREDEYRSLLSSESAVADSPVFACRFCRVPGYENILAIANEDGKIGIQDTTSSKNKITSIEGHLNAIFDVAWSDSRLRLVSVSGDHTAMLWNVSDSSISPIGMFEGHTRSVKVAAFRPRDANVFATGARDGMVNLWDYRCAQLNTASIRPDNVISNAHCQVGSANKKQKRKDPSRAESITGLVFQDENFLISCSAGDGVIKVWDVRKCYMIHRRTPQPCYYLPYPGTSAKSGFTSLNVDPGAVKLYANCMDNNIYCFNISTYEKSPVATFTGHHNHTFYVKSCLSGDGKYLLSGSSDENAYVWDVHRPGAPLARLKGHMAEVTCVDWASESDGDIKLVTCADDACHRLWRLSPPTDRCQDREPVGWVEFLDQSEIAHFTPRSMQRVIRRLERTPANTDDAKRQRTEDSGSGARQDRTVLATVQLRSDSKAPRRLFDQDEVPHCSGVEMLSPTSNLPNYVMEGTSPHHRCSSATKHKENWLIKLQTTPSPKQVRRLTPKRKCQSTSTTPKACGNLLKFFRVAAKQPPLTVTACDRLPSLLS